MSNLDMIKEIEEICKVTSLKQHGAKMATVLFNKWLFEEMQTYPDLSSKAVLALVNDRDKLEAVKIYRQETGLPLIECKRAIEDFMVDQWGFERFPQK